MRSTEMKSINSDQLRTFKGIEETKARVMASKTQMNKAFIIVQVCIKGIKCDS